MPRISSQRVGAGLRAPSRHGAVGAVWRGVARCGTVWRGVALYGAVWRGVALYGAVWRGMARYGAVPDATQCVSAERALKVRATKAIVTWGLVP